VRTPRPIGGCHQCCTSPSANWCRAGAHDLLAGDPRIVVQQREHVLELVAEP
jgi:hypothetical protein